MRSYEKNLFYYKKMLANTIHIYTIYLLVFNAYIKKGAL